MPCSVSTYFPTYPYTSFNTCIQYLYSTCCRRVEDFELHKELYRGKTSLLYQATDRKSGTMIALKLYRKRKLSTLNR